MENKKKDLLIWSTSIATGFAVVTCFGVYGLIGVASAAGVLMTGSFWYHKLQKQN